MLATLALNLSILPSQADLPPKPPGLYGGYTTTLLLSGKWLIAGGEKGNGENADWDKAMLYDPATKTWTNAGVMTSKRSWHKDTVLSDGKVIVAGGRSGGDHSELASAEIYDPVAERWATTGPMTFARVGHQLTLLANGKVLATGGTDDKARGTNNSSAEFNVHSSAELYDPAAGRWLLTSPMNEARYHHAATLLANGLVLAAGGKNKQGSFIFSAELYDPSNEKWTMTSPMPHGSRFNYTVSSLTNGHVLLTTSDTNAWQVSKLLYDSSSGEWKKIGPTQPHFVSSTNLDRTLTIRPETGSSFLASQEIQFLIESADRFGVTNISIFRDGIKVGEGNESPMRYSLTNAAAGTYVFVAKATYANGLASTSSPVSIIFKASGPEASLAPGPTEFISDIHVNSSPAILLASVVGVSPDALTNLTLNGVPQPLRTGNFILNPPLTAGENVFVLVAKDQQGRTAQAKTKIYLDSKPPMISIAEPANNALLNIARVGVRGTFTEKSLKQITVNGMPAFVRSNTFEVLNVFLELGTNTISAVAEDNSGNLSTNSIIVIGPTDTNVSGIDPVQIVADPVGGFAPLKVSFKVQAKVPGEIKRVFYDFDGDHVIDKTATDLQPVTVIFAEPGERFPVVTLETTLGRFSSLGRGYWFFHGIRINVQAPPIQISVINIPDPVDIKCNATNHLYVLSGSTATLTEFDAKGKTVRSLKNMGAKPTGFDVDENGNVYVAMSGNNQVWKFKPTVNSFEPDRTFGNDGFIGNKDGSSGSKSNELNAPFDVAVISVFDGEKIMVSDSGNHRIERFSLNGVFDASGYQVGKNNEFVSTFGEKGTNFGQLQSPKGLAFGSYSHLFIADSGNNRVVIADDSDSRAASGETGTALGQFRAPINLCASDRGICVVDSENNRIQIFDPVHGGEGGPLAPFNPRVALSIELGLKQPTAAAWVNDLLEEKIYIADTGNNRVILVKLPTDNPEVIWEAMKQHLLKGDIDGAIPYFASDAAEKYRQAYISLGVSDLVKIMSEIPIIQPVVIENDTAQYRFDQKVQGQLLTFPIEFVKENGKWKIMEY